MRYSSFAVLVLVLFAAAGCSSPEVVEATYEPTPKTFTTTLQSEVRSTLPTATSTTSTTTTLGSFVSDLAIYCAMFADRDDRIEGFLADQDSLFDPAQFEAFAKEHVAALEEMRPYVPAEVSADYEESLAESKRDFETFSEYEFDVIEMFLDQPGLPFSTSASHGVDVFVEAECGIELSGVDDDLPEVGSLETNAGDAEALAALLESESGRRVIATEMASELGITVEEATCFIDNVDIAQLSQAGSEEDADIEGFAEILEGLLACDVPLSSLGVLSGAG